MFEKILVPIDGSEHSTRALEQAIQIAEKFRSELTLIHVYSVSMQPVILPEPIGLGPPGIPMMTAAEVTRIVEAARAAGSRVLGGGEDKAKAGGIQVKKILVEGHAVEEIIRAAKEGSFDLIVMGARGISKIREMLLGSVSDAVIHHASCPVLVIK